MPSPAAMQQPLQMGNRTLRNRFIMAPLTRCRADDDHVPTPEMVEYYAQRAGFGLIICEATQILDGYTTFVNEGGIYGPAQVAGWNRVTEAVHARGGLIFCQLHHGGRSTVRANVSAELRILAPSAVAITNHECAEWWTRDHRKQPYPIPEAMTVSDIKEAVQWYVSGARNAMAAGFDGVEVHGANGYLVDEFLKESTNQRTDEYGGSVENRCRFLFEVVDAVCAAIGSANVGLRISPLNSFNDMSCGDPKGLTQYIASQLSGRGIAFLDVMRGDFFSEVRGAEAWAREVYTGLLFSGMGYSVAEAEAQVSAGGADAIVFGTMAIANPDLPQRAAVGAPLNTADPATFYSRTGTAGYTDYPFMS